jgi:hypothetical protein
MKQTVLAKVVLGIACAVSVVPATPAHAQSENDAWRFQSTAEASNRAFIEDMRMKRTSGFYSAPQYNTFIDTQNNFNCSNSASSAGNGGANTATANTPNANGASGSAPVTRTPTAQAVPTVRTIRCLIQGRTTVALS